MSFNLPDLVHEQRSRSVLDIRVLRNRGFPEVECEQCEGPASPGVRSSVEGQDLLAAFWLLRIMGNGRGDPRVRAEVLTGQATRLLTLLDQRDP